MDYKKLAADLLSGCEENCADCEYAGDSEFECTIHRLYLRQAVQPRI